MTQKLSPHNVSKMMSLYFEGYSQSEIADRLEVNQRSNPGFAISTLDKAVPHSPYCLPG